MRTSWAIALAIVCSGAAFGAGWIVRGPAPEKTADPNVRDTAAREGKTPDEATLGSDAMQLASVRRELETEQARHRETARELAELREAASDQAPGDGSPTTPAGAPVSKGPRYTFPKVEAVLAGVDWRATGESIVKMGPLLVDLAASLAAGKGLPSSIGELQRWNAPLLTVALEARNQGVPGTGIPGTFSHPSLAVNMVSAALEQSGTPLSETQAQRLGELGQAFVAEDERRLAGYDEASFQIQKTIEEAALKDRLYAAIDELLTEEQREVLHPAAVRGRNGLDIFSSAVVWNGICGPIRFQTRTDLAQNLVKAANQHIPVPAEMQPALQELAAEWARAFSDEFLAEEPDALFRQGMSLGGSTGMPSERGRTAAPLAAAFYRALYDRLPADSPAAQDLRAGAMVPVPVKWIEKKD